jgi:hypothetical protein
MLTGATLSHLVFQVENLPRIRYKIGVIATMNTVLRFSFSWAAHVLC